MMQGDEPCIELGKVPFHEECIQVFDRLKRELTHAPIMIKLDWSLPFEILCDASDYAFVGILGKMKDKHFQHIYYARKTMNEAQENYTTEKEVLAVVFAFDKFREYLVLSKTIEFDIEIHDKKAAENLTADHLSLLENSDLGKLTKVEIRDLFPKEQLMMIFDKINEPWMNPFYSSNAQTKSYDDVSPKAKPPKYFDNAIVAHQKDIMGSPPWQEKSLKPDSTGLITSTMNAN
ncbi:reverse transcriptase domain-containing protein [Tanacetum coccineum]